MTLTVIPSKLNLLRDAKPLHEIRRNPEIGSLVIDKAIANEYRDARVAGAITWDGPVEFVDHGNLVVISLDKQGHFIASYRSYWWPHIHQCPGCGTFIRCECPYLDMDFDDCLARCRKCRNK